MFHKDKRKYNIDNYKIYYLIIILLIFFNYSGQRSICSFYSNITIKIRGSGTQSIFYGGNSCEEGRIFTKPDEIYINDIRQTNLSDKYDLSQMVNTIKFVWKNSINNCNCLFKDCKNINYESKCYTRCPNGTYSNSMNCEKCHPDCKTCE